MLQQLRRGFTSLGCSDHYFIIFLEFDRFLFHFKLTKSLSFDYLQKNHLNILSRSAATNLIVY